MKFHSKRASTKIKNVKEGYPSNNKIHIYILAHLISINFLIIISTRTFRLFTTTIFNRFFYLSFYKGTTYGMISLNDVTFAKSPLHRFSRSTAFNELVANVFQPCRERSTCSQPSPPLVVFRCLCARIFYFSLYVLKRIEKRASLSVLSTRSRSKGKTARR